MSTSFSVTRNDIIKAALRVAGIIGHTQTPSTDDYTFASEALNIMMKGWMTKGVTLWKIEKFTISMIDGVNQYPIGPQAAYVHSITVTAGGSGYSGASTITLSAPGSFSGYSNTTATASLTIASGVITAVTVTNAGTGYQSAPTITLGAPGSGATLTPVMVGKTIERPLRIMDQGNFIRNSTNQDTTIRMLGRNEYMMYGAKSSEGVVNSFYYDPVLTNGQLYVYPTPSVSNTTLHLHAHMPIEDMSLAADTPDFPQEWYQTLKYGLARELIIEYGSDEITERRVEQRFREAVGDGLNFSVEEASTFFT